MRLVRVAAASAKGHKSTRPSLLSRRLGSWGRAEGRTERLVDELQRLERGLRDVEERPESASSHAGAGGVAERLGHDRNANEYLLRVALDPQDCETPGRPCIAFGQLGDPFTRAVISTRHSVSTRATVKQELGGKPR